MELNDSNFKNANFSKAESYENNNDPKQCQLTGPYPFSSRVREDSCKQDYVFRVSGKWS